MRSYRLSARAQRDIGRVAEAYFAYAGRTPEAEKRYKLSGKRLKVWCLRQFSPSL